MRAPKFRLAHLTCMGVVFLASTDAVVAQQNDRAVVEQTVRVFFDSALAGFDYALFDQMVTPDFQVVEAGEFMDGARFKEYMAQFEGRATVRYGPSGFRTRIQDDVAWTSYRNRGVLTMDGVARDSEWHEAIVLVRRDGRWLIDLIHSKSISR